MRVTIDGITYEGTECEIRRIVENPPQRTVVRETNAGWPENEKNVVYVPWLPPPDPTSNRNGSPRVTCCAGEEGKIQQAREIGIRAANERKNHED